MKSLTFELGLRLIMWEIMDGITKYLHDFLLYPASLADAPSTDNSPSMVFSPLPTRSSRSFKASTLSRTAITIKGTSHDYDNTKKRVIDTGSHKIVATLYWNIISRWDMQLNSQFWALKQLQWSWMRADPKYLMHRWRVDWCGWYKCSCQFVLL